MITGLRLKKYRDQAGFFVVEGPKAISEFMTEGYGVHFHFSIEETANTVAKTQLISYKELQKISFLKTANNELAVFEIPKRNNISDTGLILAMDGIRDPGNLGTIIRLCDWFGIKDLVCSEDTADCYNPKVVQASMGSLARTKVHYIDLPAYLKGTRLPIYGGFMDGNPLYSEKFPENAILVMGNEANGISDQIISTIQHKLTIPPFSKNPKTESLNVATATAILLYEFRNSIER